MDFVKTLGGFTKNNGYFENGKYVVSWAYGHLIELKSPEEYSPTLKKWSISTLPIVPQQFQYKVIRGKGKQFAIIKRLIHRRDIDCIINAGDPGREGELLQRLIYQQAGNRKQVKRFWTSDALSATTIRSTMKNLRPASDFDTLYQSALARQHSDWLIGMSGTRAITIALGELYSIGRVQTCILAIIVKRHKERTSFTPEYYWIVFADAENGIRFTRVNFDSEQKTYNNKITTKADADKIVSLLTGQTATIQNVTSAAKSIAAPKLFSLTTLQQEANRLFGMQAAETLNTAQNLYEKHYTSYPRTESKHLDETPETKVSCKKVLQYVNSLGYKTNRVRLDVGKKVFDKSKLTDHHAIIPQIPDRQASLSANEKQIMDLITRRFIAAFYPAFTYTQTTIMALANRQTLKADGRITTDSGWKEIYHFGKNTEIVLPTVKKGQQLAIKKVQSVAKQTEPPAEYNEADILKVMTNAAQFVTNSKLKKILKENAGIGTPATRAQTIEVLIKRKYVVRKGKTLIPTAKGIFLIDSLDNNELTKPDYTALWEQRLDEIVQGKETQEHFMSSILDYLHKLVEFSKTLKRGTSQQNKSEKKGEKMTDEDLGKCPICGGNVIETKKAYGCLNWREADGGCRFVIWKTIAKKKITPTQAKKILAGNKVPVRGMTGKSGKKFGVYLRYDKGQNKVVFDGFLENK